MALIPHLKLPPVGSVSPQSIENRAETDISFPTKAINSIEDVILRRFNIYKDITNHHRVIKTDFLIYSIVKDLIDNYLSNNSSDNSSESLQNESSTTLNPLDISGLWVPLSINGTNYEIQESLSQWNDSWLITVLRQTFLMSSNNLKMRELLLNERHYISLIKRSEDFREIDKKVVEKFREKKDIISSIIEKYQEYIKKDDTANIEKCTIENTILLLKKIEERIEEHDNKRFILTYIDKFSVSLIKNIEKVIDTAIKKSLTGNNSDDIIIPFKRISTGLDSKIYLYNDSNELGSLSSVSVIDNTLDNIKDGLPFFYIYTPTQVDDKKNCREKIGTAIGEAIVNSMIDFSNQLLQEEEK